MLIWTFQFGAFFWFLKFNFSIWKIWASSDLLEANFCFQIESLKAKKDSFPGSASLSLWTCSPVFLWECIFLGCRMRIRMIGTKKVMLWMPFDSANFGATSVCTCFSGAKCGSLLKALFPHTAFFLRALLFRSSRALQGQFSSLRG